MRAQRSMTKTFAAFTALVLSGALAHAQATRTWVSGVGDDANPCSRTAPCKTFAGAISKTATNGEINVLDPGGFGGVTITKSISIINDGVGSAGVLVSGTNAIIVNAPAASVVVLRGLDIEGLGTGLAGIRLIAGGSLTVENCTINNFTQKAIDYQPNGPSQLTVKNTVIRNNVGVNAGGILVKPVLGAFSLVSLDGVQLERNQFGVRVEENSRVTVRDSVVHGSSQDGIIAFTAGAVATSVAVIDSVVNNSGAAGLRSEGGVSTIRVSGSAITGNATGLVRVASGAIVSSGNNMLAGNTGSDGTFSSTVPLL